MNRKKIVPKPGVDADLKKLHFRGGEGTRVPSFSPSDFGKAADDYATYRKGFPRSFFERLAGEGIGRPSQNILDLGTGTGTLARGFAKQGAEVTGLDISPELLEQARKLSEKERAPATYIYSYF